MKTGTAHQSCYSVMSLLPGETLQEVADRQDMFLWDIIRMNLPGLCVEEHLSPFRSGKVEDSTLLESARSKLAVLTSDPRRSWAVELNSIAPPGGKWRDIGPEMPPTGEILMNDRLSKALESKHSFTTDELAMFEIQNLSYKKMPLYQCCLAQPFGRIPCKSFTSAGSAPFPTRASYHGPDSSGW